MIEDAIVHFEKNIPPHLQKPLELSREFGALLADIAIRSESIERKGYVMRRLLTGSAVAQAYVGAKLGIGGTRAWPEAGTDLVRRWLETPSFGPVLVPV